MTAKAETRERTRVEYGVDAPNVVATLGISGMLAIVLAFTTKGMLGPIALPLEVVGVVLLAQCMLMIRTSRVTKRQEWNEILEGLKLRGNERVLDVGCATGLVSVLAAHRLDRGRVTGIDTWQRKYVSGNSIDTAKRNLAAEGVAKRVTLRKGDLLDLPFGDGSFDLVVSSLALHNFMARTDRARAIEEIVRVLHTGGRVVILDVTRTNEYADRLKAAGCEDVRRSKRNWALFPPARVVTATKP